RSASEQPDAKRSCGNDSVRISGEWERHCVHHTQFGDSGRQWYVCSCSRADFDVVVRIRIAWTRRRGAPSPERVRVFLVNFKTPPVGWGFVRLPRSLRLGQHPPGLVIRRSCYPIHRATTSVMSSCCSPVLNWRTAVTIPSSACSTRRADWPFTTVINRSSPNSSFSLFIASVIPSV